MSGEMLEVALSYAAAGWSVFALAPRTKEPLIPKRKGGNGCYDGTTDEAQLRAWWASTPAANIGAHTKGLLVLDVDVKAPEGGITGPEGLAALERLHSPLPPTLTHRTGGGGLQFIFALPDGVSVTNRIKMRVEGQKAGLDVRTNGGYIVLPPSVHPDGPLYRVELDAPIEEAPAWLVRFVQQTPEAPAPARDRPHPSIAEAEQDRAWALKMLARACERIRQAGKGGRHETIRAQSWWIGGLLHLLDRQTAEEELIEAGVSVKPAYREVRETVRSGLLKGSARPLEAPRWIAGGRRPPADCGTTVSSATVGSATVSSATVSSATQSGKTPVPERAPVPSEPVPVDAQGGPEVQADTPAVIDLAAERERRTAQDGHADGSPVVELRAIVAAVQAAGDREARGLALAGLFEDGFVARLAAARRASAGAGAAELTQVRALRGCSAEVGRLEKLLQQKQKQMEQADAAKTPRPRAGRTLRAALADMAPEDMPPGLRLPEEYILGMGGVWRDRYGDGDTDIVCRRPLFVAAIAEDMDGAGQSLDVRWHDGRRWCQRWLPRGTALVAHRLADEAQRGMPVTSGSAKDIVAYLDAFLAENPMPERRTSATLGWRGDSFLWGREVIGGERIELAQEEEGIAHLAAGYRAAGTWEGWLEAIHPVMRLPRVYLALLAAMVPPLYRFLDDAPGFCMDWACKTSGGKTTALRVAASVWGLPQDSGEGLIRTWDSSTTGIERLAAFSNHLPLLLDDTRRVAVEHQHHLQQTIYAVSQGQGRLRGTITGLQKQAAWRTVLLSTGEDRLVDLLRAGGAAARLLCLWGSPFGEAQQALVDGMRVQLLQHHGHLGPRLIRHLQGEHQSEVVRGIYRHWLHRWQEKAGGNQVAARGAGYLALLSTAQEIGEQLGLPKPLIDPMGEALAALGIAQEEAALETKALRLAWEWAVAHSEGFLGREVKDREYNGRPPAGGWLGRWEEGEMWTSIAFLPEPLSQMLGKAGLQYRTILRTWGEQGWIEKDGRNLEYPVRLQAGQRVRCVKITRKVLEQVLQTAQPEVD